MSYDRLVRSVIVALAVFAAGCSASGRSPDGGWPDAPYCHIDCFGGFSCRDGVVYEAENRPVTIDCADFPTARCRTWSVPSPCARGCREGATGREATDVCEENVPKNEGDPCTALGQCVPGAAIDDEYGSTHLVLECDVARGVCARVATERCDGADDDSDGSVDEGCACTPRVVADLPRGGRALDVAFSGGAIALLESAAYPAATLTIVGGDGAPIRTLTDLDHARDLAATDDGLAISRHSSPAYVEEVLVLHDDGSTEAITLDPLSWLEDVALARVGDRWLLAARNDVAVVVTAHDGVTGDRLADVTIGLVDPERPRLLALGTSAVLVTGTRDGTDLRVLDSTLGVGEITPVGRGATEIADVHGEGARLTVATTGDQLALAAYDVTTDVWTRRVVGFLHDVAEVSVATLGDEALVTWRDASGTTRTVVLDAAGERVGTSELALPGATSDRWLGMTALGARLVLATEGGWRIVAPCGDRHAVAP